MSRIDDIKAALADRADALLVDLLGEPTRRSAHDVRYGKHGSLSYSPAKGVYFDHEIQHGGSLLDLISARQGISVAGACRWAEEWLSGHAQVTPHHHLVQPRPSRIESIKAICAAARGASGTPVERYLRSRGITHVPSGAVALVPAGAFSGIPGMLWWRWAACTFLLTDVSNRVCALQLVALKDNGCAVTDASGKKLKRTIGPIVSAAIRLPGDAHKPLVLCEGPETALAAWQATGLETWAACSPIARHRLAQVPLDRVIIVAADDDPQDSTIALALGKAVARWRDEGRSVVVAYPWVTCGRRPGKDILTFVQHWSGAVTCPAC